MNSMKKLFLLAASVCMMAHVAAAQPSTRVPAGWKWLSNDEVAFSYNRTFTDKDAFAVQANTHKIRTGVSAPQKFSQIPLRPEGAVNLSYSPDSTMLAFTRGNNLFVAEIATGLERQLTFDGNNLILNGYASWVYYEEILGRASNYKAFWWSPDSKTIAYYRFDNANVPMFPIYSPKGQDGSLNQTRYPKAGESNPEVKIGFVGVDGAFKTKKGKLVKWTPKTVWADFDEKQDQYFGIPFWGDDSQYFFVAREPRIQNTLDLYRVKAADGSKSAIYHETYKTWLDWPEDMLFTKDGLYMIRAFETGWEQIYYLSYDGKTLRRLTDGKNWRVRLVTCDDENVYYTAQRESVGKSALYQVSLKPEQGSQFGRITALTDPAYAVSSVSFSPDNKHFVAMVSNFKTPNQVWLYKTETANLAWNARRAIAAAEGTGKSVEQRYASDAMKIADARTDDFNPDAVNVPFIIQIAAEDGQMIPAIVTLPSNFDPSKKYGVRFYIYGGPNTAQVSESWRSPVTDWHADEDIIRVTADSRAAGHNGRAGTDLVYRDLTTVPVKDFVAWAEYFRGLPYVDPAKIGVEGFSFGGTMTTMLLLRHSDIFRCGIAGGGVYDWRLYDTHYTERFMETPQTNPDGYEKACALNYVKDYPIEAGKGGVNGVLKITHGTGDDNVHFQNTLQLIDKLQAEGKSFQLMIYPDGMHGYRGAQGAHSNAEDKAFWIEHIGKNAKTE